MADLNQAVVEQVKQKSPAAKIVDLYDGRLPDDIKQVFKLARVLIVGNEIVAPVIARLAETPITSIQIKAVREKDTESTPADKLEKIFDAVKAREHMLGLSFDLFGYSNGFSSIYFKPTRYLVCPRCEERSKNPEYKGKKKHQWKADNINWVHKVISNPNATGRQTISFNGNCPNGHKGVRFERKDRVYHTERSIRLIRWDPFNMDIDHYRPLSRSEYYYKIPRDETRKIAAGDRIMLNEYPWEYIDAAINFRLYKINKKGFHHFKLESISGVYDGWGVPRILSVLTALYAMLSMVKANEATAVAKINDLTIISPTGGAGARYGDDPIGSIGAEAWISQVRGALAEHRKDKTTTALLPFPVNAQQVFGQGRAQLITGELNLYIKTITAALGLPDDVIYSGGNYTSVAVASRIMANLASVVRKEFNRWLKFMKDTMSYSLRDVDFSSLTAELEPYESADDFQRLNMQIQMAMNNRFPWTPIWKRLGLDFDDGIEMLKKEGDKFGEVMLAMAKAQGKSLAKTNTIQQYFMQMDAHQMSKSKAMSSLETAEEAAATGTQEPSKTAVAEALATDMTQNYLPEEWEGVVDKVYETDPELGAIVALYLFQFSMGEFQWIPPEDRPPIANMVELGAEPEIDQLSGQSGNGIGKIKKIGKSAGMPESGPPKSETKL